VKFYGSPPQITVNFTVNSELK